MSFFASLIAATLVTGLACAAPTSSTGVVAMNIPAEGSVDARANNGEPRADEVAKRESEIDLVARMFLGSPERKHVRWGNATYPWLTMGNVYFVYSPGRVLVVGALGDGKPPLLLTDDPAAISTFVSKQAGGRFIGFAALAKLLRDVAVHPTGSIGTPDLLLDPRDVRDWMQGREKDPNVFKSLCAGIAGNQRGNEWQLQFNVFNVKGGVAAVSASGTITPFTIRQLKVTPVKPAGEFNYPFAG
jgi:hypothetical protein